jgi:DNA repair protein RadC
MMTSLPRFTIRPTYPTKNALLEEPKQCIVSPKEVFDFIRRNVFVDPTFEVQKEHLVLIALDNRLQLIGYNVVSVGTSNECLLKIGETIRPLLVAGSSHFFLVHNHPSGNTSPSFADRAMTTKVAEASKLMELRLIDHVIVSQTSYYSFREHGLLD